MKCAYVLFSRTLTKDYRWMITPQGAAVEDLARLKTLFGHYSDVRSVQGVLQSSVPVMFCLSLSQIIALVVMKRTDHVDAGGRDIFCLQGITTRYENARTFRFLLPFLVQEHASVLDAWRNLDFHSANRLEYDESAQIDIDVRLGEQFNDVNLNRSRPSRFERFDNRPREFAFSQDGLHQLISFLSSPYVPLVDFGFGVTSQMLQDLGSISVFSAIPFGNSFLPGRIEVRRNEGTLSQPISHIGARPDVMTSGKKMYLECEIIKKEISNEWFWPVSKLSKRTRYRFVAVTPDRKSDYAESVSFDDDASEQDILRIHSDFVERLGMKGWQPKANDPTREWYALKLIKWT